MKVTHEKIALLAYFYWKQRGGGHGRELEDWFQAEHDLTADDSEYD
jgi:Protein of unknown function (DUF2934)